MKKTTTKAAEVYKYYTHGLGLLDPREKDIIERYYGFGGNMRHTLEEIAKHYKVTRERIRQIKHYAIKKISPADKTDR